MSGSPLATTQRCIRSFILEAVAREWRQLVREETEVVTG